MFVKQDKHFDEMAVDPKRRREGIADLTSRRNLMFWCAMAVNTLALVTFIIPEGISIKGGGVLGFFGAAVQWMLVFKLESDLRLLRVIERLHLDQNHKTSE